MSESRQDVVLNPRQREAVEHVHGPMLVVAGAGTGKTTVLTERISRLIAEGLARADQVLAVTFTRNAAQELRTRVAARVGPFAGEQILACTFHSYCAELLKTGGRPFQPLEPEDLWIYLRLRISTLGLEHFIRARDLGEFLGDLLRFFDRCSDENIDASAYSAYGEKVARGELPVPPLGRTFAGLPPEQRLERLRELARVYRKVEDTLAAESLGTFGRQITRALHLLRENPMLLEACSARARFILVDEFQDCNSTQIQLVHLLAGREANVFAVGDPDQAIYRFRGASSAAFEQFVQLFPGTRGLLLEDNQRSRAPILESSYELIRVNPPVKIPVGGSATYSRKPLRSAREEAKHPRRKPSAAAAVEVVCWASAEQEAAEIAKRIDALLREYDTAGAGLDWSTPWFGVLYRAHDHRKLVVAELAQRGIPFLVKGVDVRQTAEVRDLLAVLRAVDSPADSESLFRAAALPVFAVPAEQLRRRLAAPGEMRFVDILSSLPQGRAVLDAVEQGRRFAPGRDITAVVTRCLDLFRLDASSPAISAFRDFVEEWKRKPIVKRRDLREFLDYMAFFPAARGTIPLYSELEQDKRDHGDPRPVRLMTVHSAKGLEFRHVFLVRAGSPSFPANYTPPLLDFPEELRAFPAPGDGKSAHQQEERRLFYVAMTRARDTLALYAPQGRGDRDKTPAGFLRTLLSACQGKPFLKSRNARPFTVDLAAAAAPAPSSVGGWFSMPPQALAARSLSAHSVEAYNQCPLRYKLDREWNIPGEPTAAIQFGIAVHSVLKRYYDPHAPAAMSADDVAEMFRAEWAKVRLDDGAQHALYARNGATQLRALVALRPRGSVEVLATEMPFHFELGALQVGGRMDRVDALPGRTVRIIDYKTGRPRLQKHADTSLQLSIYAMAAEHLGHKVAGLVFLNLEDGEEIVARRDPRALDKAREQIQEAADGIARGDFDPRPGFHCRWCDYAGLCPATEEKLVTITGARATRVN